MPRRRALRHGATEGGPLLDRRAGYGPDREVGSGIADEPRSAAPSSPSREAGLAGGWSGGRERGNLVQQRVGRGEDALLVLSADDEETVRSRLADDPGPPTC